MSDPEQAAAFWQTQFIGLWKWPIPISTLLLVVFGLRGTIETVLARDLLIVGSGTFLCGILLRFVTLPTWEADPARYPREAIALQRTMVAPLTIWLGAMIAISGCALFVLPNDPMVTKIIGALLMVLMIAVAGTIMIRAWRLFRRPKRD